MVPTQDKIGHHGHFIKKCSLIQEMLSLLSMYIFITYPYSFMGAVLAIFIYVSYVEMLSFMLHLICLLYSYGDFLAYTRQKKNKTYILKPETGCQGRGIWVTRNPKEIKPHEHMICQQYMAKVSVET